MPSGLIAKSGIEPASRIATPKDADMVRYRFRKPPENPNLPSLSAGFRTTFQEFAPPD